MSDRMRRVSLIHLIGIGGAGMGGIAEVLMNLGYAVQGSDLARERGDGASREDGRARSSSATRAGQVAGASVVVVSSRGAAREPGAARRPASRASRWCAAPRCSASSCDSARAIAVAGTPRQDDDHEPRGRACWPRGGLDPTFVIGGAS